MNRDSPLHTALLDLLYELRDTEIRLILGGGFGIYLRAEYLLKQGRLRTMFPQERWPEARSTNDLDLFLRPELFVDAVKLKPLADALKRLGYRVIEGAEHYQFVKTGIPGLPTGALKIDLLTGPRGRFKELGVRADKRRAHPQPSIGLHAHPVDEAPTLEEKLTAMAVSGALSPGVLWTGDVFLPHPFSFLTMKLCAFRDRRDDRDKDSGRHHALDLYTIVATTTESEWQESVGYRDRLRGTPVMVDAAHIVREFFSQEDRLGIIRLKESRYFRPDFEVGGLISALMDLFVTGGK